MIQTLLQGTDARKVALTLFLSVCGGLIALWLGVPAPLLIGGIVTVGAASFLKFDTRLPGWLVNVAFVIVGLLSVPPTLRFIRWNRAAAAEADYTVPDAEILAMRRYLWLEALVLALVIIFAAMMARGYGV